MPEPVNRKRLEFATVTFLAEMRRQAIKANPNLEESPVKSLDDYSPEHRSALMNGLRIATDMMKPEKDPLYQAWLERQAQERQT